MSNEPARRENPMAISHQDYIEAAATARCILYPKPDDPHYHGTPSEATEVILRYAQGAIEHHGKTRGRYHLEYSLLKAQPDRAAEITAIAIAELLDARAKIQKLTDDLAYEKAQSKRLDSRHMKPTRQQKQKAITHSQHASPPSARTSATGSAPTRRVPSTSSNDNAGSAGRSCA